VNIPGILGLKGGTSHLSEKNHKEPPHRRDVFRQKSKGRRGGGGGGVNPCSGTFHLQARKAGTSKKRPKGRSPQVEPRRTVLHRKNGMQSSRSQTWGKTYIYYSIQGDSTTQSRQPPRRGFKRQSLQTATSNSTNRKKKRNPRFKESPFLSQDRNPWNWGTALSKKTDARKTYWGGQHHSQKALCKERGGITKKNNQGRGGKSEQRSGGGGGGRLRGRDLG